MSGLERKPGSSADTLTGEEWERRAIVGGIGVAYSGLVEALKGVDIAELLADVEIGDLRYMRAALERVTRVAMDARSTEPVARVQALIIEENLPLNNEGGDDGPAAGLVAMPGRGDSGEQESSADLDFNQSQMQLFTGAVRGRLSTGVDVLEEVATEDQTIALLDASVRSVDGRGGRRPDEKMNVERIVAILQSSGIDDKLATSLGASRGALQQLKARVAQRAAVYLNSLYAEKYSNGAMQLEAHNELETALAMPTIEVEESTYDIAADYQNTVAKMAEFLGVDAENDAETYEALQRVLRYEPAPDAISGHSEKNVIGLIYSCVQTLGGINKLPLDDRSFRRLREFLGAGVNAASNEVVFRPPKDMLAKRVWKLRNQGNKHAVTSLPQETYAALNQLADWRIALDSAMVDDKVAKNEHEVESNSEIFDKFAKDIGLEQAVGDALWSRSHIGENGEHLAYTENTKAALDALLRYCPTRILKEDFTISQQSAFRAFVMTALGEPKNIVEIQQYLADGESAEALIREVVSRIIQ